MKVKSRIADNVYLWYSNPLSLRNSYQSCWLAVLARRRKEDPCLGLVTRPYPWYPGELPVNQYSDHTSRALFNTVVDQG